MQTEIKWGDIKHYSGKYITIQYKSKFQKVLVTNFKNNMMAVKAGMGEVWYSITEKTKVKFYAN